jgi:DNA mismatch endonuclease (patch repair protein)
MAAIRSSNTVPEIILRQKLHGLGFRFRVHRKDLPGRPDIVLPKYKTVVFVNGCFWHQHQGCSLSHWPQSRQEYWEPKLNKNVDRDKRNQERLRELGWKVIVVWECELKSPDEVASRIEAMLRPVLR